jgi:hypothetical protein
MTEGVFDSQKFFEYVDARQRLYIDRLAEAVG